MSETQKIFNIKAKYYKKIFCRAEQIQFGEQTNQATGEIQKNNFKHVYISLMVKILHVCQVSFLI